MTLIRTRKMIQIELKCKNIADFARSTLLTKKQSNFVSFLHFIFEKGV